LDRPGDGFGDWLRHILGEQGLELCWGMDEELLQGVVEELLQGVAQGFA